MKKIIIVLILLINVQLVFGTIPPHPEPGEMINEGDSGTYYEVYAKPFMNLNLKAFDSEKGIGWSPSPGFSGERIRGSNKGSLLTSFVFQSSLSPEEKAHLQIPLKSGSYNLIFYLGDQEYEQGPMYVQAETKLFTSKGVSRKNSYFKIGGKTDVLDNVLDIYIGQEGKNTPLNLIYLRNIESKDGYFIDFGTNYDADDEKLAFLKEGLIGNKYDEFAYTEQEMENVTRTNEETTTNVPTQTLVVADKTSSQKTTNIQCTTDKDCTTGHCNSDDMCVQCILDGHCGPIEIIKEEVCSPDNKQLMEKTKIRNPKCDSGSDTCYFEYQDKSEKVIKDCQSMGTLCYNNSCGCPPGARPCEKSNKCELVGAKKEREYYLCDFECSPETKICVKTKTCEKEKSKGNGEYYNCEFECLTGFGLDGQCIDPITSHLSFSKTNASIGTENMVTLSLDSALNNEMDANIIIYLGNGLEVSSSYKSDYCTGNMCKLSKKITEKGIANINLGVVCTEKGNTKISSKITYSIDGKSSTLTEELPLICGSNLNLNEKKCTGFWCWLFNLFR